MIESAITTRPYRLTPAAYLRKAAGAAFPIFLIAALTLMSIAAFVAATADSRWLYIGLMILFMIIPAALAHIFYFTLLTPEAADALALKRVTFIPGKHINIDYLMCEPSTYDGADSISDAELTVTSSKHIDSSEIDRCSVSNSFIVIRLKNKKLSLLIPISALPPGADPYNIIDE